MKEIKSKKTGRIQIISEEEYAVMVKQGEVIKRFTVTDVRGTRVITPPQTPVEIKKITKKTKNEG